MSTDAPLGEFELIARYFAPIAAPGAFGLLDDAACLTPPAGQDLVLTKDALISGVHFFADDPPELIARKALRVNLSDLAAKGARPLGFLLGFGRPDWVGPEWMAEFARGLADDSRSFRCPLYGGDTIAAGDRLVLSVTALGAVPAGRMVLRGGARPGDVLFITGAIGEGALGLIEWRRRQSGEAYETDLAARYLLPQPRLGLAPVLLAHASAAMDVSDGLIGDAAKMAEASGCALTISLPDVPLSEAARRLLGDAPELLETAVTGGDDYEILAATPPAKAAAFEEAAAKAGIAVTRIGRCAQGAGLTALDGHGNAVTFRSASFSHF